MILSKKLRDVEEMWNTRRPYTGDLRPKEALEVLTVISKRLEEI